jgi:hypothetical protein
MSKLEDIQKMIGGRIELIAKDANGNYFFLSDRKLRRKSKIKRLYENSK